MQRLPTGRGLLIPVVMLVAALAMPASPARGQGTSGMLASPIATGDLIQYGDRLGLSAAQRRAAESFHDQYKREFRVLRDGDIAQFMTSMRSMQMGGVMPSRAVLETFFEDLARLQGRIAAVDRRLFDQIQPLLTDEQVQMLPRVRSQRERARYASAGMLSMMSGGTPTDLSEITLQAPLTDDERAAVDPILIGYERRLTLQMRKQYEASTQMFLRMFDALEARGIDESTWSDPEKAAEVQEAAQEVMMEMAREGMEAASKTHEHNRRTLAKIDPALERGHYRAVRDSFLQRAYPELTGATHWRHPFTAALQLESLTEEQRGDIEALRDTTDLKIDGMLARGMKMMDKLRENVPWLSGDPDAWQERQSKVQEFQTEMQQASASAMQGLTGILGPELSAQIPQQATPAVMAAGMGMVAPVAAVAASDAAAESDDGETYGWGMDQFLPPRISRAHLGRYADILSFDDNERAILEAMLESYDTSIAALRPTHLVPLHEAASTLWQHDPDTGAYTATPDRRHVDRVYELRREALRAIRSADEAFFTEIDETLLMGERPDALARVRLARERETWDRGAWGGFASHSSEANIDLDTLVRRQRWKDDDAAAALDPHLAAYQAQIMPLLRERYDLALENQRSTEMLTGEYHRRQAAGELQPNDYQDLARELMGDTPQRMKSVSEKLAGMNRAALDGLQARLPEDKSLELRQAYRSQAFPNVYNDTTALQSHLQAAAGLGDLSAEQRSRLNDLTAGYLSSYESMCDEMITHASHATPMWTSAETADWVSYQEHQEAMEKLRFDRDELNARAQSRLRSILGDAQIARIGGLPDIGVAQARDPWGM